MQVELLGDRERARLALHLERPIGPATASDPAAHRAALALELDAGKRDEPEALLPALVRLLVLLVVRRAHVLQPDRVPKVDREQGPLPRRRLGRVLVLTRPVRDADDLERHAHVPHTHHRVVGGRLRARQLQGNREIVLCEHVLRHVCVRVVLREKHDGAAKPWDGRERRPPLPDKVSALWVPQLIAPWVWWVVQVRGRSGVFYLGEEDGMDLIS